MKPRTFAGIWAVTAVAIGPLFGLLWSVSFSWSTGRGLQETLIPGGLVGGVAFGLAFGAVMAFRTRFVSATIPLAEASGFAERLDAAAAQLSFSLRSAEGATRTYAPSFRAGLLTGNITADLGEGAAVLSGPRYYLLELRRRLDVPR